MKMSADSMSKAATGPIPVGQGTQTVTGGRATAPGNILTALPEYTVDAFQRGILFLDLLRQRGDQEIEITSQPLATVLSFGHEVLMDGRSLPRPMNYTLSRIAPPPGIVIDPRKRPVVVTDPRAGQGPGVGGFKSESEIGDALRAGHPVYFIGFAATPVAGQQFLDVVEGLVSFFEHVVELHPDAPRPFAIGNCQAGYQTLMVAILRPDLFGPCLVAGSPMSYWQGEHGKNPMRYACGLLGGSWLVAMMSDLGAGKIDGTNLVLNFDANWLWGTYKAMLETGGESLALDAPASVRLGGRVSARRGPGRPAEIHSFAVFLDGAAMAIVGAVAVASSILLAVVLARFYCFRGDLLRRATFQDIKLARPARKPSETRPCHRSKTERSKKSRSATPPRPSAHCRPATCEPGPRPLAKGTISPTPARARRPPASSRPC